VVLLPGDGSARVGEPADVLAAAAIAPPVAHLGRLAGWSPVPLSVRDARRLAPELRTRLAGAEPGGRGHVSPATGAPPALDAGGVTVRHGDVVAVRSLDLSLVPGEVVALMGRNGSGKSSLLWALQGTGRRDGGTVRTGGVDPASLRPEHRRRAVALLPQSPADLLYLPTIGAECRRADEESGAPPGTARAVVDRLLPGLGDEVHPRDLSEGGRLVVALAVQLAGAPPVVLLDEPTRGLDHLAKERLGGLLHELAGAGRAVVVATHDVEFAAATVDRVVVLAEGEVVADGTASDILCASPAFAPQVAKVLAPQRWLDVGEVAAALAAAPVRAAP
jgi:energy-coupling factor transport system ATP-binding protein